MSGTIPLRMIVAMTRTGGIGYKGSIPWHYPQDLKRFRRITGTSPIIMGRKTWDSLPKQPLPGRLNIVITRDPIRVIPASNGMRIATSPEEALRILQMSEKNYPEAWVIGGQMVYEMFIHHPLLETIDCTIVPSNHTCDTFFVPIPERFKHVHITETPITDGLLRHHVYSLHSYYPYESPSPDSL